MQYSPELGSRLFLSRLKVMAQLTHSCLAGNSGILKELSALVGLFVSWWTGKIIAHPALENTLDRIGPPKALHVLVARRNWMKLRQSYYQYIDAVCPLLFIYNPSSPDPFPLDQIQEVLDKIASQQHSWIMRLMVRYYPTLREFLCMNKSSVNYFLSLLTVISAR